MGALPKFVVYFRERGRIHYYFRRKPFPYLRLSAPDAPEFSDMYARALACKTREDMMRLRAAIGMGPPRHLRPRNEGGEAIIAWAERRPLTSRQIEILMRSPLRLTREELLQNNFPNLSN